LSALLLKGRCVLNEPYARRRNGTVTSAGASVNGLVNFLFPLCRN